MTEQMQGDQTNIPISRDFYGYAGAGPLTVTLYSEPVLEQVGREPKGVHVGWGDGGMYLEPHQARALARFLVDVAAEAGR
jgi:hypothetical protein